MNREQMIVAVVDALTSASWPDRGRDGFPSLVVARMLAPAILDAVLPQITTGEELDALPSGTLLVGKHPDVHDRQIAIARGSDRYRYTNGRHEFSSARVAKESGPLTVVWQP